MLVVIDVLAEYFDDWEMNFVGIFSVNPHETQLVRQGNLGVNTCESVFS